MFTSRRILFAGMHGFLPRASRLASRFNNFGVYRLPDAPSWCSAALNNHCYLSSFNQTRKGHSTKLATMQESNELLAEYTSLAEYFDSNWQLHKKIDYGTMGGKGTFDGVAKFVKVSPSMLWYKEEGTLRLENGSAAEAHKTLYYQITDHTGSVYFVDDPSHTIEPLILNPSELRHFFNFNLSQGLSSCFEHYCEPDTYTGRLSISSNEAFTLAWRIVGPHKDGNIEAHYSRK